MFKLIVTEVTGIRMQIETTGRCREPADYQDLQMTVIQTNAITR